MRKTGTVKRKTSRPAKRPGLTDQLFRMRIAGEITPVQSAKARIIWNKEGDAVGTRFYQPRHVENYAAFIRQAAATAHNEAPPIDGPLWLGIVFWLPRPTSRPAHRYPYPDRMPDTDNCKKPVQDALEKAGVIVNDSRICAEHIVKLYATAQRGPGMDVTLRRLAPQDTLDLEGFGHVLEKPFSS